MTREQLQALRPGDRVAYESRTFDHKTRSMVKRWRTTTVSQVLATQIKTADGMRWNRKNGRERGRPLGFGYDVPWLREATPERIQAAQEADEHEALVRKLGGTDWAGRDLATLRAVVALLDGGGS